MGDQEHSPLENDELSEYDIYSKTPPRTKILRKNRERNMRDRQPSTPVIIKAKGPIFRRHTSGNFVEDVLSREENTDEDGTKRVNKRQMRLLRGSERDLKLDIARAQAINMDYQHRDDMVFDYPRTPSYQIESNKRFMSLMGRTFPCPKTCHMKKVAEKKVEELKKIEEQQKINDLKALGYGKRVEFFLILSSLLKMGENSDKSERRVMSKEESMWQNELKDLIWLELQAYHADRTPMEEDTYLCVARECVEPLLNDIKNYKFQRQSKRYTSQNSDSGVEEDCPSCASIHCYSCMEAQNEALKEIEVLLKRLEDAESLFPSTSAFAELYPLYRSPEIVGRIRVMCQWYNLTKHQRLKLNLLGRLVVLLESKHSDWPCFAIGEENGSVSPSDSNNSTSSSGSSSDSYSSCDMYNITTVTTFLTQRDNTKVSPYRRYIENILKTRALDNSLNFLEKLHNRVLKKTRKTLDLPKDQSIFSTLSGSYEDELYRYGCWSPEFLSLELPSYRGIYIFLATVPLDVIHEYLLMRLEQKPTNPSALSVRQLMNELKQGLKKAVLERELACKYIDAATAGTSITCQTFKDKLEKFDDCVQRVFSDYLDYLREWMYVQRNFRKSMLEDEYTFAKEICSVYPHLRKQIGSRYACILGTILGNTGERLIERINSSLNSLSLDDSDVKQNLFTVCRELQSVFNEEKETSIKTISFVRTHLRKESVPVECIKYMKDAILTFQSIIPDSAQRLQTLFDTVSAANLEEADKLALNSRIREIVMRVFSFGFEFYKELNDLSADEYRPRLVERIGHFAYMWIKFVTERCDRGRGIKPRWANQGMDFLLSVSQPNNTTLLSDTQFEELKTNIDLCISHLIGKPRGIIAPSTPDSGFHSASPRNSLDHMRARSRGSSPSPRPTYKSQRSGQSSRKVSTEQQSPGVDSADNASVVNSPNFGKKEDKNGCPSIRIEFNSKSHAEKFREAIYALESELDSKLTQQNLIGKVLEDRTSNKNSIMRRNVNFSWQRGIKIGQGRFGKVYTAVNNNTGDMMAVKEIALQHNDMGTLKQIAEEMKILEGISHKNLVKSYGVEVHKDEMLIFMEYCSEGTLESLVADTEKGLPELQARKYTFQLVSGVACLHDHGIVHRDIKTANIFLTNGGHCLKIGDFGCAAKIKSNMTMPGELKGFVGTQAYMAPEVFTKNMSEGHGRAADIWSVGCVVVEMVSGQRPWAQFDSNVQIMFKVGMGQSPDPPDDMIDEGLDFLDVCFKHNPKERATARELLVHDYVKLGSDYL